jgi:NADP-dependent 3-hydroxy acid dehydrogenase YdfG
MAGHKTLEAQSLEGKVAIVTGSARGLGAEMVIDLARRGAKVSPEERSCYSPTAFLSIW